MGPVESTPFIKYHDSHGLFRNGVSIVDNPRWNSVSAKVANLISNALIELKAPGVPDISYYDIRYSMWCPAVVTEIQIIIFTLVVLSRVIQIEFRTFFDNNYYRDFVMLFFKINNIHLHTPIQQYYSYYYFVIISRFVVYFLAKCFIIDSYNSVPSRWELYLPYGRIFVYALLSN